MHPGRAVRFRLEFDLRVCISCKGVFSLSVAAATPLPFSGVVSGPKQIKQTEISRYRRPHTAGSKTARTGLRRVPNLFEQVEASRLWSKSCGQQRNTVRKMAAVSATVHEYRPDRIIGSCTCVTLVVPTKQNKKAKRYSPVVHKWV